MRWQSLPRTARLVAVIASERCTGARGRRDMVGALPNVHRGDRSQVTQRESTLKSGSGRDPNLRRLRGAALAHRCVARHRQKSYKVLASLRTFTSWQFLHEHTGIASLTGSFEMANSVANLVICAENPAKLADFQPRLFGWHLDQPQGLNWRQIQTAPTGANSFGGGLTYRPVARPHSWIPYINVASLNRCATQSFDARRHAKGRIPGGVTNRK